LSSRARLLTAIVGDGLIAAMRCAMIDMPWAPGLRLGCAELRQFESRPQRPEGGR
jgi:hypothetical protein